MRSNIHVCFHPDVIDLPKLVIVSNTSGRTPLKKLSLQYKSSGEVMDSGALVSFVFYLCLSKGFKKNELTQTTK